MVNVLPVPTSCAYSPLPFTRPRQIASDWCLRSEKGSVPRCSAMPGKSRKSPS